ncbi:hypothetical protein RY831_08370 [Noviherbaspirillum sp. CPCC 100848]|uniref:DUF4089 domain-containing protein n=1 Tax=Noviherbaspirillum album TaxID=3080276 RepID=A0ABU6J6K3_9BURK|nr:hypothetical protein [Noviherbaspirillum sp. CPCC 100848]MEC4719160.1 hypothetical protein [Noviherbaspirillum sp. CPCC 100848]
MEITQEMVDAAVKKAIEAGILPRRSCPEDIETNVEIMLQILEAAFEHLPFPLAAEPSVYRPSVMEHAH